MEEPKCKHDIPVKLCSACQPLPKEINELNIYWTPSKHPELAKLIREPLNDTKDCTKKEENSAKNSEYAQQEGKDEWEEEYDAWADKLIGTPMLTEGICLVCGIDPVAFKDFIRDIVQKERESLIKEIVKLADEIECIPETSSFDVWRSWKYFRNTLRDKYLNTLK